ncbi:hypothetical protein G6F65_020601 [Rhizopus arrhizus]|nr:hypothetical protein G6F65_020601 [Rhizopus arrhizus]
MWCSAVRGVGNRAAADLVADLRPGHDRHAPQADGPDVPVAGHHLAAGLRLHVHGSVGIPAPDPPGLRSGPQCLPVGVLRPGRHPRPARQRRPAVAAGDVRAAEEVRPDPDQQDPHGVPEPVLALPGPDLDRRVLRRLPQWSAPWHREVVPDRLRAGGGTDRHPVLDGDVG